MAHSLIKNGDQEGAPLLWCDRPLRDLVALLKADLSIFIDALHNRDELHEIGADVVTQEAIHFQRVISVGGVDSRQDVELDLMFLQEPCSPHDLVERRR